MLDVADGPETCPMAGDSEKIQPALEGDRNFSISCELGLQYPTLKAMLNKGRLASLYASMYIHGLYLIYTSYIPCISQLYMQFLLF